MCQNQIGRRNMTEVQKQVLIAQEYEAQKNTQGGDRKSEQFSSGQKGHMNGDRTPRTRGIVAKAHGISERAVRSAVELNNGLDAADTVSPGFKDAVLTGTD